MSKKLKKSADLDMAYSTIVDWVAEEYVDDELIRSSKRKSGSLQKIPIRASIDMTNTVATVSEPTTILFTFLSQNLGNIRSDNEVLKQFEELVSEILAKSNNQTLKHVMKTCGWTGRYFSEAFILEDCMQALANLYIYQKHFDSSTKSDEEQQSSEVASVVSFVPDMLLIHVKNHMSIRNNEVLTSSTFDGAAMIADIAGFSKYASTMCALGVQGLDDLHDVIGIFLADLIDMVYKHGGDVVAFAGDSLLCIFQERKIRGLSCSSHSYKNDTCDEMEDIDLTANHYFATAASVRAVQCGLALRDYSANNLYAHVAIGFGEMKMAILGGFEDSWVHLINGACIYELASCLKDAGPQQLVITQACYAELTRVLAFSVQSPSPSTHKTVNAVACSSGSGNMLVDTLNMTDRPTQTYTRLLQVLDEMSPQVLAVARLFVPEPALAAICTDSLDRMAELRCVTSLFVTLDSYNSRSHHDPMALQPFLRIVQEAIFDSGGYLRQFVVNDKGCCAVIMWGVPSFSYASNCSRSLYCAGVISVKSAFQQFKCSIGVATGVAYCGAIGGRARKDYVVIGNEVNLACRLMSRANGRILLDKATYEQMSKNVQAYLIVGETISFPDQKHPTETYMYARATLPDINIVHDYKDIHFTKATSLRKHIRVALTTQLDVISNMPSNITALLRASSNDSLRSISNSNSRSSSKHEPNSTSISSKLNNSIAAATSTISPDQKSWGRGAIFTVIIGVAGTGKTTAARYYLHAAQRRNLSCLSVQCRHGDEANPFSLIRKLFVEIVGQDNFRDEYQQRKVLKLIVENMSVSKSDREAYEKMSYATLENILGLSWSFSGGPGEMARINGMHAASHDEHGGAAEPSRIADNDKTFYDVLCILFKNRRTVIVIEDAHYCDELSWHQIHQIILGDNLPAAILITSRTQLSKNSQVKMKTTGASPFGLAKAIFGHMGGSSAAGSSKVGVQSLRSSRSSFASSRMSQSEAESNDGDGDLFGDYGFGFYQNSSFLAIMDHGSCVVLEMGALNDQEIREILQLELGMAHVNNDLVASVMNITSGNAFWCKAVAQYIKENGIPMYSKSVGRRGGKHNSLKTLIMSKFDILTLDQQFLAKQASIIGDEFSLQLLNAVLPKNVEPVAFRHMAVLLNHCLITCVDDVEGIFAFQNKLIRNTIYDLTPPRDSSLVHLQVADFIEQEYSASIWDHYPILSYHYRHANGHRDMALQYTMKAAHQVIRRGAFSEGFIFLQTALPLAVSRPELRALLDITNKSIKDINPSAITGLLRNLPGFSKLDRHSESAVQQAEYTKLRDDIERTLTYMSRGGGGGFGGDYDMAKMTESIKSRFGGGGGGGGGGGSIKEQGGDDHGSGSDAGNDGDVSSYHAQPGGDVVIKVPRKGPTRKKGSSHKDKHQQKQQQQQQEQQQKQLLKSKSSMCLIS